MPFDDLLQWHCRAAIKVHGKAIDRIRKAGAVQVLPRSRQSSPKVSECVWHRRDDVGRAAKEAEGMVVAEDWDAVFPRCVIDWEGAIEIDTAVEERVCQYDCIGMDRRDDVSTWRKFLGSDFLQLPHQQNRRQSEPEKVSYPQFRHYCHVVASRKQNAVPLLRVGFLHTVLQIR